MIENKILFLHIRKICIYEMREVLVGDLHFGVKTNNVTWLEYQINLVKKQLFDIIENKEVNRVVFLGDLFDIRYAINQQVGIEVKKLIREMSTKYFDKDFVFIAGNHDYYSPLEEFADYNAYELIFGEEFLKCHENIKFVNKEPLLLDQSLFLPWYYTENPEHFDDLLYLYQFGIDVKAIYCHADLSVWPGGRIASLKGCPVYSGHIHYITEYEFGNLHNLGAALPLTFNDVNQSRYFYILEDYKMVDKIENVTTPRFKRVYNEAIFTLTEADVDNCYMQLCVSTNRVNKAEYIDQIKYLKTTYTSANIRLHVVEDDEELNEAFNGAGFNTNIHQYIEDNIPEHLENKYELIKTKLAEQR